MNVKELMKSKCEKDYYNNHYFQSIGCVGLKPTFKVLQCTQCNKIIHQELETLVIVKPSKKRELLKE